jgi:integrase
MPKLTFTKASLDTLAIPESGYKFYHDEKLKGLCIRVGASGAKTFYVYKRIGDIPEKIKIGSYPGINVERARELALKMLAEIAEGRNPKVDKKAQQAELTFAQLFQEYMERHAKIHKKTYQQDRDQFDLYLARQTISKKRLSAIARKEVEVVFKAVGERGKYAANRLLALVRSVFNHGIQWEYCKNNPALGIKPYREESRDRFLSGDELQRFFEAVNSVSPTMRDYFLVSLFTGVRRSNVMAMRWNEVDLDRAEWRIPETKNGKPQRQPLVPEVAAILMERAKERTPNGIYVFPSEDSASGHIEEPKKAFAKVLAVAGLENLRLHDLRRTLGSYQAMNGDSLLIISKTLGHTNVNAKSTEVYTRLHQDPIRDSLQRAVSKMKGKKKADT